MKNFIVHDINGNILRTGSCPDDMMEIQAGQGELVMEGKANDIEDKIVEGKITRKTEAEIDAIKESMKPDPKEILIQNKMQEILRKQAIDELAKEGKL